MGELKRRLGMSGDRMPDRGKYIEFLSQTVKAVKKFNDYAPIEISLVCVEDILKLL